MKIIDELETALAAATGGKWDHTGIVVFVPGYGGTTTLLTGHLSDGEKNDPNIVLAVLMKNHLPALIEAAKALQDLVICPAFNGQVFEKDKESHKAWSLARAALEKFQ